MRDSIASVRLLVGVAEGNRGWGRNERTVHGEALAVVPARILGDEVLEVLVGVVDVADLVDVIDEVPGVAVSSRFDRCCIMEGWRTQAASSRRDT